MRTIIYNPYLIILVLLLFISCVVKKDKVIVMPQEFIRGDWLILYPQHKLNNEVQRKIYGKVQDSIVDLMGLKLISFKSNGEFLQMDSLFGKHGNWVIADSGRLNLRSAGKGFEDFNGVFAGVQNDTMLISEYVLVKNERIKLVWHLKKIFPRDEAAALFKQENNLWRQKPVKKEPEEAIRNKIISMLKYYALYYKLVSNESIYFLSGRVALPFTYYQHAVGLKKFNDDDEFCQYFFDTNDAIKGYRIIKGSFEKIKSKDFPSGENFVIEYSRFFEMLARNIM